MIHLCSRYIALLSLLLFVFFHPTIHAALTSPAPSDAESGISRAPTLAWSSSAGLAFDVYLGTSASAVTAATHSSSEYLGSVIEPSLAVAEHLRRSETYYWRVDELDAANQVITTGAVWSFTVVNFDINDRGDTVVTYDYTDVRSISAAPAVGVHPRVFFGPSELPGLRDRLQNTASGQAVRKQVDAYMKVLELGYNDYDRNASYAVDSQGRALVDNVGLFNVKAYYDALLAGAADPLAGASETTRILLAGQIGLRAFTYLIDEDAAGLAQVGTVISNLSAALDTATYSNDYQCYLHLATAYDFAYNEMTTTQRDTVRTAIVTHLNTVSGASAIYGTYEEAYASTSNWTALVSFPELTYMAVEGESALLNTRLYEGGVRGYHNFLTYGWYPSGAGWEGLGKNYMFATTMIAYARRGENYLGHPHVRAYAEEFLPATMQPFGYAFSAYDSLGGTGTNPDPISKGYYKFNAHDAIGLKWIFPHSPEVDFMWRNYVGDEYDYRGFSPRGYHNDLLLAAIYCSDYTDDSAWDSSAIPLTFFAGDRGLMHTRSDTTQDAMSLQFHSRQDLGGHTNSDRLNFNMSALGRTWAVYRTEVTGGTTGNPHESKYHSTVLIDDVGVLTNASDGVKARQPAKVVYFDDQPEMTTVAGDATYAYSWEYDWSPNIAGAFDSRLSSGWTAVQETLNDFRYTPGTETHHDIPLYDFASWIGYPEVERIAKRASLPMDYIYRTASMVRAENPYVLIVDDVALTDGQSHHYKWQMQLPDDLTIESTDVNLVDSDFRRDIILKEPSAAGNRRLLVRVLQNEGYTGTPGYIETRFNPRDGREDSLWPALVVSADTAESPAFKILLFPHEAGDTLPHTEWNGNTVSITTGSDTRQFYFQPETDGRTTILSEVPALELSVREFTLEAVVGDSPAPPVSQLFYLSSNLDASQNWTAVSSEPWLNLSVSSGALSADSDVALTASIDASLHNFSVGTYTSTVTFSSDEDSFDRELDITVHVVEPIAVTPSVSAFDVVTNEVESLSQILELSSRYTGSQSWTVSSDQAWLTLSTAGGSFVGFETANVAATIGQTVYDFSEGSYVANVTFTSSLGDRSLSVPITINVRATSSIPTEEFTSSRNFDLDNKQLTFVPAGSSYRVYTNTATALPQPLTNAEKIVGDPTVNSSFGGRDDGYWTRMPAWTNAPVVGGSAISNIHICTNGFISFDPTVSYGYSDVGATKHFEVRQVSAFWRDLSGTSGEYYYEFIPGDRAIITFEAIPIYGSSSVVNTAQIELFDDGSGKIRVTYLRVDATSAIVGLSLGTGVDAAWPADMIDFSELGILPVSLPVLSLQLLDGTSSEWDTSVDAGSLRILSDVALPEALSVNLTLSGTAVASDFSGTLSAGAHAMSAGATQLDRTVQAVPDGLAEGTEDLQVTLASGNGYTVGSPATVTISLLDEPYDAWRFTNDIISIEANADDDGDGVPTLVEYGLGSDPKLVDRGYEVAADMVAKTVTITMDHPIPANVTLSAQWSTSLVVGSWSVDNVNRVGQVITITGFTGDQVFVRLTASLDSAF